MGTVYKAYDTRLQRIVALKTILPKGKDREKQTLRFQRETRLAAQLNHPHIIPIYEVGEIEKIHYFTMGYIEGINLREYIKQRGTMDKKAALEILAKVLKGVSYAHSKGIIHRDLKPENIVMDHQGEPYIMDFGLAKQIETEDTRLTQTGVILGTPEFMAPEQAYGDQEVGIPADIYALGGILYFLLTGRSPFQSKDLLSLLRKVVESPPPPLTLTHPHLSRAIERVVHRCLAKDPQNRYGSAEALEGDLNSLLEGKPLLSLGNSILLSWIRKHPKRGLLFIILLSILIGMGVWVSTREKSPPEKPRETKGQGKDPKGNTRVDKARPYLLEAKKSSILGRWRETRENLSRASRFHPLQGEALLLWAQSLAYTDRIVQAEKVLEKLELEMGMDLEYQILKAYLSIRTNQFDRAKRIYFSLQEKKINHPDLDLGLAFYEIEVQKNLPLGISHLKKALSLAPQRLDLICLNLERTYYNCPLSMFLKQCNQALLLHPQSAKLHELRGRSYKESGETLLFKKDLERSLLLIEEQIKKYPRDFDLLYQRLCAFYALKKMDQFPEEWKRLEKLYPHRGELYGLRGGIYNTEKDDSQSLLYYKKSLQIYEEKRRIRLLSQRENIASTYYVLGKFYSKNGRIEKALTYFQKAIKTLPKDSYYHWLGIIAARKGETEEALRYYEVGNKIDPHNTGLAETLAVLYINKGHYARAIEVTTVLLQRFPEKAEPYYLRGMACYRLGELFRARKDFEKVLQYSPNPAYRKEIKKIFPDLKE